MSAPAAPTMSTAGNLTSPEATLNFLFLCFLASERSQSVWFNVNSLPYLVQKYSGKNDVLLSAIKDALELMYQQYFESVNCSVTGEPYAEDESKFHIRIRLTAVRDGVSYELSRAVNRTDIGKFTQAPL